MRIFFFILSFFLCITHGYSAHIKPPTPLPVPLKCTFTLIDLETVDTKKEQFTARAYFKFEWMDPRLAFKSDTDEPEVYLEESAKSKLDEIWWPDLEFPNSDELTVNSRGLFIFPDGKIKYVMATRGVYHTNMDFKKFPFDQQELRILIDSFIWNNKELTMIVNQGNEELISGTYLPPEREILIKKIDIYVTDVNGLGLGPGRGLTDIFSTYVVAIFAGHGVIYYLFQAFIPIVIIMAFVNLVFFDRDAPLIGKISAINLGFVALIALKFTLGTELPQINYMTILDEIFLIAYIFLGIAVFLNLLDPWLRSKNPALLKRLTFHTCWAFALSFICVCILFITIKVLTLT